MGATTAAFVLVVLPRRFVLQAGLIESGISFTTRALPFWPSERSPLIQPVIVSLAQPVALGHAELFWSNVLPLLEDEHFEAAIPLFLRYLADHPENTDVWREYAVVLTRSGRVDEAVSVYHRLLEERRDSWDVLAFARLLRDEGQYERSLELYRELAASSPHDVDLYHELAQTLVWAERYREAAQAYRNLLTAVPGNQAYRLELARILYWDNYPVNALVLLADFPSDSPYAATANDLSAFLDSLLLASLPLGETTLERARRARAELDYAGAAILYQTTLGRAPHDVDLWLEWADFLQFHSTDLAAARDALLHISTLRNLSTVERFRLAQLHMWTGHEQEARELLVEVLSQEPGNFEAWAMLGDLYQWQGRDLEAADAYRRALALSPGDEQAAAGLASLKQRTAELIAEREYPGVGPELVFFRDSDDFERLELAARANLLWSNTTVAVRAGYRRVQGTRLEGVAGMDEGPFAEVEVGHWWRMGTVRTALTAGVESFEASGTEPSLVARIDVPDLDGTTVQASLSHGRAFPQTATYESVQADLLSDFLQVAAFRQVAAGWSMAGSAGLATFHGAGSSNVRANAAASARRELSPVLDAALTSQFLSFSDSAPRQQGRRLYWDPSAFWSNGLQLGLHTSVEGPWRGYVRLTPGLALVDERDTEGLDLVPQIGGEGGVRLETTRIRFRTDAAYLRGREGDYSSFGITTVLTIKF
jgi:tetratricopeptide (TPR) repeat protein